jgi:cytochrome c oxidase subunit 2
MALLVVADSARDFAAWQDHQLEETPETANAGQRVFQQHCAICHTTRGLSPSGIRGPDLTHLMTRRTLASGLLMNNRGDLAGWITNPQAWKPGARMPAQLRTGGELTAVTEWLTQLYSRLI